MAKTLLVDGSNVLIRGVFAMSRPGSSELSAGGVPTGALLVFINTLSRYIKEEQPDRVMVCWDGGASEYRRSLLASYKANRAQREPEEQDRVQGAYALAKEFCALANIPMAHRPGVEADDIIAYQVSHRDGDVVILSSDKDFLQLIGPGVSQIRLMPSGAPTDRWGFHRVMVEFGCQPRHLPAVFALAGDDSDGIPGIPRFGIKTAVKVLKNYGFDLDAAVAADPRLRDHAAQIRVNLQLVNLRVPMDLGLPMPSPWDPTSPRSVTWPLLSHFLDTYQLGSVRSRLYSESLWQEKSPEGEQSIPFPNLA